MAVKGFANSDPTDLCSVCLPPAVRYGFDAGSKRHSRDTRAYPGMLLLHVVKVRVWSLRIPCRGSAIRFAPGVQKLQQMCMHLAAVTQTTTFSLGQCRFPIRCERAASR